jgi:general secretion pathway protein G
MASPAHWRLGHLIARGTASTRGLTLVELLVVLAVIATLSTIAFLLYASFTEKAMVARAIADIANISSEISTFQMMNERLPVNLAEVNRSNFKDPWGQAYVFLDVSTSPGLARKDGALVPINTDFDLYSKGKDGSSATPLTASQSQDDIVRANDGQFVGLAANF